MQFQFRYTDNEFRDSLRVNGGAVPQHWKAFLLIVLCVLPSLLIFWWLNAGLSLVWFGVMTLTMLASALHALVNRTGFPAGYDQVVRLSDDDFQHSFSHSVCQVQWGLIDEIRETNEAFQLSRLARTWLIPKRVLGSQVDECREFFRRVKNQPPPIRAVDLYQQIFDNKSPFPVYRFKYRSDDLDLARKSRFELIRSGSTSASSTKNTRRVLGWLLFALAIGLLIYLNLDIFERPRHQAENLWPVVAGWVLPFFMVLIYSRVALLLRRRSSDSKVPPDECELRLTATGWSIGDRQGVLLSDWRDVGGIFHSPDFFGFKTINQQLNLIPRRIFADQAIANRFLAEAMDLHWRSKNDDNVPLAAVVESGNPYQTPSL